MNYYGTSYWAPTDSLSHHGILGQKWGKKNGPPYPLGSNDHSSSEKKAGWRKSLSEKRDRKNKQKLSVEISKKNYSSKEEAKNDIKSRFPSESIPNINELQDSYSSFIKAANNHSDFFDSKECADASNKAYDDTISWFRENDPNYLNTIIKNNGGSEAGLDAFHDFRKLFEGYEDIYWQKAEEKFYRNESNRKAKEAEDRAYEKYVSECKKAVNSILGDYGSEEIKSLADSKYFWNKSTVRDVVTNVVEEYSYDKIRRKLDE